MVCDICANIQYLCVTDVIPCKNSIFQVFTITFKVKVKLSLCFS
jgi:hypothetical protein